MRSIGKDDGFTRIKVGRLVRVSPKRVEASRRVHAREGVPVLVPTDLPREPGENALKNHCFHLCQEALGGNFLTVGKLYPGEPCERSETGAHAGNDEVSAGDTQ